MIYAHCFDGMICIPNCDKIVPGMLMGAMRCNIPTVFVSGGPMEAGRTPDGKKMDLIDVFIGAAAKQDGKLSRRRVLALEQAGCPTCGSCSGMFTANSMNCLCEALGMALPTNGTLLATSAERKSSIRRAAQRMVEMVLAIRQAGHRPRPVAAGNRHPRLHRQLDDPGHGDGRQHEHRAAHAGHRPRGGRRVRHRANQQISRQTPNICKVAPSSDYHVEDVHNAGGIHTILGAVQRGRPGLLKLDCPTVSGKTLGENIAEFDIRETAVQRRGPGTGRRHRRRAATPEGMSVPRAAAVGPRNEAGNWASIRYDCIREVDNAYSQEGGLVILYGNLAPKGAVVKAAGVGRNARYTGPAVISRPRPRPTRASSTAE